MTRVRWLPLALVLAAGCSAGHRTAPPDYPGGQARGRPDPLLGAAEAPTALAAFAAPMELDGGLGDPCWSTAAWQGSDPAFAACCDRSALYLAIRRPSRSSAGRATGPGERRDGPLELGEVVALRLAPPDHQEMFIDLLLAPDGTVADRQMAWTPDWVGRFYQGRDLKGLRTASRVAEGVWTAEVAIPWDALWNGAPRPDGGAILRLQAAARDAGETAWRSWPATTRGLGLPPSGFGLLLLGGVMPPWRVLHGELVAGPSGRLLALALVRGDEAPPEAELVVEGDFAGRATLRLDRRQDRVLLPVETAGPGRQDGYGLFTVRAMIGGRSWPLGGWHQRDPLSGGAGSILVPGVGGESSNRPLAAAGLGLAATAVPVGRKAVDLRMGALAPGPGPWRLRVSAGGTVLASLDVPRLPAVAAIPVAGLAPGRHALAAVLSDSADTPVLSARLPLEIVP
jgi:hypothetical protein